MNRLLLLIAISTSIAIARGWEDFFHTAANYYTLGQKQKAAQFVQDGLYYYPDNPQLNALGGLLTDEEQEKQQQEQQQSQDQNQDQQEEQKQENSQKGQEKQSEEQQQTQEEQESQDQKQKEQLEQSDQSENEDQKQEGKQEQQVQKNDEDNAEQVSEDQLNAAAILDALKDDEKIHQKRQIAKKSSRKLEKDW